MDKVNINLSETLISPQEEEFPLKAKSTPKIIKIQICHDLCERNNISAYTQKTHYYQYNLGFRCKEIRFLGGKKEIYIINIKKNN